MTDSNHCQPTGLGVNEFRMVQEVAREAADRTAERIISDVRLEMANFENRIGAQIGEKLEGALGMSPMDHYNAHENLQKMLNDIASIKRQIRNRLISTVITAVLAVAAALYYGEIGSPKHLTSALDGRKVSHFESKKEDFPSAADA